jgi:hypothetical protein
MSRLIFWLGLAPTGVGSHTGWLASTTGAVRVTLAVTVCLPGNIGTIRGVSGPTAVAGVGVALLQKFGGRVKMS